MDERPDRARKGRGAVSNRTGRYEHLQTVAVDDGWLVTEDDPPPIATRLVIDSARSVITANTSPDVPFERSINPYRGCEHGCIYCYARPNHAWIGLSPGLDFETVIHYKPDAAERLEETLRKPGYTPVPLALGTATDPYQPVERGLGVTRRILTVLEAFTHPVMITTKSALVLRDLDILGRMAARRLASVAVSMTTLDRDRARTLEPRASTPARRLLAIRSLADAGVPVTVLAAPLIPGLTDHELEAILAAAKTAGAGHAASMLIRLPGEVAALFEEWLGAHVPDRAQRILNLIRQCRSGALNDATFGRRMRGEGPYAALIAARHRHAVARLALDGAWPPLDTTAFQAPSRPGDQLQLF